MWKHCRHVLLAWLLCWIIPVTATTSTAVDADFATYQKALQALSANDTHLFRQTRQLLKNYPLLPYLDAAFIEKSFSRMPTKRIEVFLKRYEGTYVAKRLVTRWLKYLGKSKNWKTYLKFYKPEYNSDSLACYAITAELSLHGESNALFEQIESLWQKPYSLPDNCDPLFKTWKDKKGVPSATAWSRFQMAIEKGNRSLAQYLVRYLEKPHAELAQKLLDPKRHMSFWKTAFSNNDVVSAIEPGTMNHIIMKLTHIDYRIISTLITSQILTDIVSVDVKKLTAWYIAAEDSGEKASAWIQGQNDEKHISLQEASLRYLIQEESWVGYLSLYETVSLSLREKDTWRYWYAKSLKQTSQRPEDLQTYQDMMLALSNEQSFYGFLAAEELGQEISVIKDRPKLDDLSIDDATREKLLISLTLFMNGEDHLASLEWYYATRNFSNDQWRQAGILASQFQWHQKSIHAFAQAKMWHAIDQRFPIVYNEHFETNAKRHGLSHSWLIAMARQESAFASHARSSVGATGVLQLMPRTAKKVAKQLNTPFKKKKLTDPAYNIQLGSFYLKEMLDEFNGNYVLATAAYNAGPNKVKQWLASRPMTTDWVLWVETIPYKETRNYVKNILAYSRIYDVRLGLLNDGQNLFNIAATTPATQGSSL